MANLTYSNLFSQFWQNIFDLVNAIPDPENRGTKFVYASFPDARFEDKTAYPLLVIPPVDISSYDYMTIGTTPQKIVTIPAEVNIFALKAEQLDSLTDSIFAKFEDSTSTLFSNKMKTPEVLRTRYSNFERGGMKVHLKSIVYGFRFDFTGS